MNVVQNVRPPRGQWADQILTSRLFGLPTTTDDATVDAIRRYNQLKVQKSRSKTEREETARLLIYLTQTLGSAESGFEERIQKAVAEVLRGESDKEVDKVAANFEIIRQLREMSEK